MCVRENFIIHIRICLSGFTSFLESFNIIYSAFHCVCRFSHFVFLLYLAFCRLKKNSFNFSVCACFFFILFLFPLILSFLDYFPMFPLLFYRVIFKAIKIRWNWKTYFVILFSDYYLFNSSMLLRSSKVIDWP